MNKTILLFCVALMMITTALHAQSEEDVIKAPIVKLFDGLSALDEKMIRAELTSDFQLLEDGMVWTADSLVSDFTKINKSEFSRINRFDFIKVTRRDNVAWVSYFNEADITVRDRKFKIRWLESAVLVREGKRWRISFLHSTRLRE
jgi:hypothetical protein